MSPAIEKNLKILEGENPEKIKKAIEFLSIQTKNPKLKEELIERLGEFYKYENDSPLWSLIILDQMRDPDLVLEFLDVFETEDDLLIEAAIDALVHLERSYPNSALPFLFDFIGRRILYDPYYTRIAAYNVLRAFVENEEVKKFLIHSFEEDYQARDFIARILVESKDKRILEIFKRGLEYAKQMGDEVTFNVIKWAYFDLEKGIDRQKGSKKLWDMDWKERWNFIFEDMEKTEKEREKEEKIKEKEFILKAKNALSPELKKELEEFKKYSIPPFNLEKYLQIKEPSLTEEIFQKNLILLGLSNKWTVKKVQKLINESKKPSQTLEILLKDFVFPSREAMEIFNESFDDLWNDTPREEFNGLTPFEKAEIFKKAEIIY
jgi:hypothetical protein